MAQGDWIRFPHTFEVYRNVGADNVPPTQDRVLILSGVCSVQNNNSGNMSNSREAMLYDYVAFHKEPITTIIKAEDEIKCTVANNQEINGVIKKSFTGQLTSRIWFNEISK